MSYYRKKGQKQIKVEVVYRNQNKVEVVDRKQSKIEVVYRKQGKVVVLFLFFVWFFVFPITYIPKM